MVVKFWGNFAYLGVCSLLVGCATQNVSNPGNEPRVAQRHLALRACVAFSLKSPVPYRP
jgi:hypothetical protein